MNRNETPGRMGLRGVVLLGLILGGLLGCQASLGGNAADGQGADSSVKLESLWSHDFDTAMFRPRFLPGGSYLLAPGYAYQEIWDYRSGERLAHFEHEGSLRYAGPGAKSATVVLSYDGVHQVRDWKAKKLLREILAEGRSKIAALSPDGRQLLFDSRVWRTETGESLGAIDVGPVPNVALFSADGSRLLIGGHRRGAVLWRTQTPKQLHDFELEGVSDALFSPGAKQLVIAHGASLSRTSGRYATRTATVFNTATGNRLASIEQDGAISCMIYTGARDGLMTATDKGEVVAWSAQYAPYKTWQLDQGVSACAGDARGGLWLGLNSGGLLYLAASASHPQRLAKVKGTVTFLSLSEKSRMLAVTASQGAVHELSVFKIRP